MKVSPVNIRILVYRTIDPEKFSHDDTVEHTNVAASFTLANGFLEARLNVPSQSLKQACAAVEPVVLAWEFESEVRMGFEVIKFERTPVSTIQLTPPSAHISNETEALTDESHIVILSRYPQGPTIRVTQDMESIWNRYKRASFGFGESLQSAVYYGLTVIEARFGSRTKASTT